MTPAPAPAATVGAGPCPARRAVICTAEIAAVRDPGRAPVARPFSSATACCPMSRRPSMSGRSERRCEDGRRPPTVARRTQSPRHQGPLRTEAQRHVATHRGRAPRRKARKGSTKAARSPDAIAPREQEKRQEEQQAAAHALMLARLEQDRIARQAPPSLRPQPPAFTASHREGRLGWVLRERAQAAVESKLRLPTRAESRAARPTARSSPPRKAASPGSGAEAAIPMPASGP